MKAEFKTSIRKIFVAAAAISVAFSPDRSLAEPREAPYRVLEASQACMPCGATPHYVVTSKENIGELHTKLVEKCGDTKEPDAWRQSILGLGIDFRSEALITLYEVIGSGGRASLDITGPKAGVLKARIKWHTGPPPHPPIATAACLAFAVQKGAVKSVTIKPGGIFNKDRTERTLAVPMGK